MNLSHDLRFWIAMGTILLAMYTGLIFRTRLCAVIVLPFPIAGLFISLPKIWWWLPVVLAITWIMLLGSANLVGMHVPKESLLSKKQTYIAMAAVGLPLAALVVALTILYFGWDFFKILLRLPGIWILIASCAFLIAAVVPMLLWNAAIFGICPLLAHSKEACQAKRVYCVKRQERRGRHMVSVWYISFDTDPTPYRASWMFGRRLSRKAMHTTVSYEKCSCPMGVTWIKNVHVWN